jgi:hypothetical protein
MGFQSIAIYDRGRGTGVYLLIPVLRRLLIPNYLSNEKTLTHGGEFERTRDYERRRL